MDRREFTAALGVAALPAWAAAASESDAAAGIRAALERGALAAVAQLGRTDGFLGNPQVRIPLPGHLEDAARLLRTLGQGRKVDELVTAMNRAAEAAMPEAKAMFVATIKAISVEDALRVVRGGPTSVTEFFAAKTRSPLAQKFLPIVTRATEKVQLAAFAVSEPDAGSDVSSLRTKAVYDEAKDEWVLNGTKTWITNGGIADIHVVVASVDSSLGSRGQASFIVPPGTPGISQGQKFQKMGIRASHTAEVVLEDCRVPGHCLLGGKDKLDEKIARAKEGKRSGGQAAMKTFEGSRPTVGAQALGIARAAFEYSLEYAKERKAFGRAIIENQAIAFKLADMKTRIDASRLLVWRASWMGANGKEFTSGEGSMSKLYAGETAVYVTEEAIQILGGYGYVREYPVERWHRDSKIFTIFEGTSEIQRLIISRAISGVHIK